MELSMKSTGIVRNIDELGRIVVPKEIRQRFGIEKNDPVEIYVENECIILRKYTPVCHFCGSTENISDYKNKCICASCVEEISKL